MKLNVSRGDLGLSKNTVAAIVGRARVDAAVDIEIALKAIIEGKVAGQRSQWRLLQAFGEAASRLPNSDLPASMARMRNVTLDLAKQALYECSSEIMHPDKERAVDFAVRILAEQWWGRSMNPFDR